MVLPNSCIYMLDRQNLSQGQGIIQAEYIIMRGTSKYSERKTL